MAPEKRVLIVDDEHRIADTLKIIFSNAGYSAKAVYSAEEALPLIAEWNPHLLIVDVRLPEMNGIDLAIRVKAEYPLSNMLLFSGDSAAADSWKRLGKRGTTWMCWRSPFRPMIF